MAINQVNVTFKKSEMDLLDFLSTKSSKSGYIKDAIREKMQRELQGIPTPIALIDQPKEDEMPKLKKGKKTLGQFL